MSSLFLHGARISPAVADAFVKATDQLRQCACGMSDAGRALGRVLPPAMPNPGEGMRLHAEHHRDHPIFNHARVSLDGRLLEHVVMADEERGQVIVLDISQDGVVKRRLRGRVRIVDSREWDVHSAYTRCDRD